MTRHVAETHEVRHTFRHRSKEPISSAGPIVSQSEIHAVHPPVPPVDEAHFVVLWHWRHGGVVVWVFCPVTVSTLYFHIHYPRHTHSSPFSRAETLRSFWNFPSPRGTISVPTRNHESNPLRMSREFDSYPFHPCLACFGFRLHEVCHC